MIHIDVEPIIKALNGITMDHGRPVKNTSKRCAYNALQKIIDYVGYQRYKIVDGNLVYGIPDETDEYILVGERDIYGDLVRIRKERQCD